MMRSLSSAVAGLKTHQTKMDVIGNNIANVNTYGFKRSRVTFADVYYQSLSSGSKPDNTSGGTNPTQIGYGSAVATTDVLISQAGSQSTGRAMDVYISGDGFLAVTDATGNLLYTRLGILGFDAQGNIINSSGNFVQGISVDQKFNPDGSVDESALRPLKIPLDILNDLTGLGVNNNGDIVGTRPGATTIKDSSGLSSYFAISNLQIKEGSYYRGTVNMTVAYLPDASNIKFDVGGTITDPKFSNIKFGNVQFGSTDEFIVKEYKGDAIPPTITMNIGGRDYSAQLEAGKEISLTDTDGNVGLIMTCPSTLVAGTSTDPVGPIATTAKFTLTVKDEGGNEYTYPDTGLPGNASGPIYAGDISFTFDSVTKPFTGSMATISADTETIVLGTLVLAKFPNSMALEQVGDSYFSASANSGEVGYFRPGSKGTGALASNYLESSNVDVSQEFTDMITTQRGFQANTRIITVSDEMLQELANLKR